jgi:DNA-directed RNA polymerase beta' subunit
MLHPEEQLSFQYGFEHSKAPIKKIDHVQFAFLPNGVTDLIAENRIKTDSLFEKHTNTPLSGGLFDNSLGFSSPENRQHQCGNSACDGSYESCPGHFGKIELTEAVVFPNVIMQKRLNYLLSVICWFCGELVDNNIKSEEIMKLPRIQRLRELTKKTTKKLRYCTKCNANRPIFKFEKDYYSFFAKGVTQTDAKMALCTGTMIGEILARIPIRLYPLLGLRNNDVRNAFIIKLLPVMPPIGRPYVNFKQQDKRIAAKNSLTERYRRIIAANNALAHAYELNQTQFDIDECVVRLQLEVYDLYLSEELKDSQDLQTGRGKTYRPACSISSRMNGKHGTVRGHIMGTRGDFCARSVISPDPNLRMNEVGIPWKFAQLLTKPMHVNAINQKSLNEHLIMQNKLKKLDAKKNVETLDRIELTEYEEAKRLCTYKLKTIKRQRTFLASDGASKSFFESIDDIIAKDGELVLQQGDIVERTLKNGDLVLFNRQPTLHKLSMMAHTVRIVPGGCFRFHPNMCPPYNADYDGDDMNIFVPQSEEAEGEMLTLMLVQNNLIDPKTHKMAVGLHYDAILGANFISIKDCFFTREEMFSYMVLMQHTVYQLPEPALLKPNVLWTGKQLISLLFPPMFNFGISNLDNEADILMDSTTIIKNSELLVGTLIKANIATNSGNFLPALHHLSSEHTLDFMDDLSQFSTRYLLDHGFSIGISDTVFDASTQVELRAIELGMFERIRQVLLKHGTPAENDEIKSGELEEEITYLLRGIINESMAVIGKKITHNNNAYKMMKAGSKGGLINICQISGTIGQQLLSGNRVPSIFGSVYAAKRRGERAYTLMRPMPHDNPVLCNTMKTDIFATLGKEEQLKIIEYDSEAHGLIHSSLLTGLTPREMFYSEMSGRIGVVNRGVRTSDIGYMDRRWVKCTESIVATYNGLVVDNEDNRIISFLYGGDGIAVDKLENHRATFVDHTTLTGYLNATLLPQHGDSDRSAYLRERRIHLADWTKLNKLKTQLKSLNHYSAQVPLIYLMEAAYKSNTTDPGIPTTNRADLLRAVRDYEKQLDTYVKSGQIVENELLNIYIHYMLSSANAFGNFGLTIVDIKHILEKCIEYQIRNRVEPGTAVGLLAVTSVSQDAQQDTLNTMHLSTANKKNVIDTFKQLLRLCNSSKKKGKTVNKSHQPNIATLYVKEEYGETFENTSKLLQAISPIELSEVIFAADLEFEEDFLAGCAVGPELDDANNYWSFKSEHDCHTDICLCNWALRICISIDDAHRFIHPYRILYYIEDVLSDSDIVEDLCYKININDWSTQSKKRTKLFHSEKFKHPTDNNNEYYVMKFRFSCINSFFVETNRFMKVRMQKFFEKFDTGIFNSAVDVLDKSPVLRENIDWQIIRMTTNFHYHDDPNPNNCRSSSLIIHLFYLICQDLLHCTIHGERGFGVNQPEIYYGKKNNGENPYCLRIVNSSFDQILGLQHPLIDHLRTTCDSPIEILNTLGIEAANAVFLTEFRKFAQSSDAFVNYHHLQTICDFVTQPGYLTPINYHGLAKLGTSPMQLLSFERPVEVASELAFSGKSDNIRSPSSAIIAGQEMPLGTGYFDLMMSSKLPEPIFNPMQESGAVSQIEGQSYESPPTPITTSFFDELPDDRPVPPSPTYTRPPSPSYAPPADDDDTTMETRSLTSPRRDEENPLARLSRQKNASSSISQLFAAMPLKTAVQSELRIPVDSYKNLPYEMQLEEYDPSNPSISKTKELLIEFDNDIIMDPNPKFDECDIPMQIY